MADIKWIKITTNIFDDEKIKIIDTMPARDEILVIWFKLLALAGKVNQSGMLFMNSKIAYTPEMLSAIFNRELGVIKLALNTFETFGMIEVEDNQLISIANWEKHQNIDGMEKIRLQTKERVQKHREQKKQNLLEFTSNVSCNVTVTDDNETEEELEEELELELDNKEYEKLHVQALKINLELDVNDIWKAYPIKKGRSTAFNKIPKILNTVSKKELLQCITRYDKETDDKQYMAHGSTFFNGKYEDYLDKNYQEPVKTLKKTITKNPNNRFQIEGELSNVKNDDLKAKMMKKSKQRSVE